MAVAMGLLAITLSDLRESYVAGLLNFIVCIQIYRLAAHWFWPSQSRAVRVHFFAGLYWVTNVGGHETSFKLVSSATLPIGVGLRLYSQHAGYRRIVVVRDSVDAQSFRRARVWLRFAYA